MVVVFEVLLAGHIPAASLYKHDTQQATNTQLKAGGHCPQVSLSCYTMTDPSLPARAGKPTRGEEEARRGLHGR